MQAIECKVPPLFAVSVVVVLLAVSTAGQDGTGPAQEAGKPVPELVKLRKSYEAVVAKRGGVPDKGRLAALNKSFASAIDKKIASATKAGDVVGVMGLRGLKESFPVAGTVPANDAEGAPPVVVGLCATYRTERAKIEREALTKRAPLAPAYAKALDDLQVRLVKDGRIDDAAAVKDARVKFLEENTDAFELAKQLAEAKPAEKTKKPVGRGFDVKPGKVIMKAWGELPTNLPPLAKVPEDLDDVVFLAGPPAFCAFNKGFVLAVRADGTVTGWGEPTLGVLKGLPKDLQGIVEVAAHKGAGAARTADGELTVWNKEGSRKYEGESKIVQLGAGRGVILGVTEDGRVVVVAGHAGQLPADLPVQGRVKRVRCCDLTYYAILDDGSVFHWGNAGYGRGAYPPGLKGVVDIHMSRGIVLALMDDGKVEVWGSEAKKIHAQYFRKVTALPEPSFRGQLAVRAGEDRWKGRDNDTMAWPRGCTRILRVEDYQFGIKPEN